MKKDSLVGEEDWSIVKSLLPEGWEEKAKELRAFQRSHGFKSPEALLRTLLVHLSEGLSYRHTSTMAKQTGLANTSDVAVLKRLRGSKEWLCWMASEICKRFFRIELGELNYSERRFRLVDGSSVQPPGSKGTGFRLHFSMDLHSLACDEFMVTGPEVGESLKHFTVNLGDIFLADRCYANASAVAHVVEGGGDIVVRAKMQGLNLVDTDGKRFNLLRALRSLQEGEIGDWKVCSKHNDQLTEGRICAVKKSSQCAEAARRKILKEHKKKGKKGQVRPETLEAAGYIIVFTTLDPSFTAEQVLELYRLRWQVELAFKRLKSLLKVGSLPNKNPESAKAWIHGKLLVAFLTEALIIAAPGFFPWGFPIRGQGKHKPVHLEGNIVHGRCIA